MHHQAPPPSHRWAPLLLACLIALVALTAAIGGGRLPRLPGTADAATTTDAAAPTGAAGAERPEATAGTGTGSASTTAVPVPSTAASSAGQGPSASSASSSAAAQPTTPESTTQEPRPADSPAGPPPVSAPAPAAAAAPAPGAPGPEGQVLELVNAARVAAGCAPVGADPALAAVARAHSADMRDRGYFSHVDPDGLDPFARARAAGVGYARAENIARGQPDATAVMAAWTASPGHLRNILDCGLTRLGVGLATGRGGPWWTQLFGA